MPYNCPVTENIRIHTMTDTITDTTTDTTCISCRFWEVGGYKPYCTKKQRYTPPAYSCNRYKPTETKRCGTCYNSGTIHLDTEWRQCPTCTADPLFVHDDDRDITHELAQAQARFLANLRAVTHTPERFVQPAGLLALGIRVCSDCGKPNPVERSHCKGCDAVMNFKHKTK